LNQLAAVGLTIGLTVIGSFAILKFVDLVIGLRVSEEQEIVGLDRSLHGEEGYDFGLEAAFAMESKTEVTAGDDIMPGFASDVAFEGAAGD
jgi:hypothetical protein